MDKNCWESSPSSKSHKKYKTNNLSADVYYKKSMIKLSLNNDSLTWNENGLSHIIKFRHMLNVKRSKSSPNLCVNYIAYSIDSILQFQKFKIKFQSCDISEAWSKSISKQIKKSFKRIKSLLFFIDKISDRCKLDGFSLFNEFMKDFLHDQNITYVIKEINSVNDIDDLNQVFEQIETYDGIVIMSGDETASVIMSNVINFCQVDDHCVKHVKVPFTIIPIGNHNDIVKSIWKCEDIPNIFLNIFLCDTFQIDVLSLVNDGSKYKRWGFNCHYGYYTILEKCRISNIDLKENNLKKALKTSRSSNCVIQYKSSSLSKGNPLDQSICTKNCSSCNVMTLSVTNTPIISLNTSIKSASRENHVNYEIIKPSVAISWIVINSIPCQNDTVGNAFSPSCHLNDGSADIVLVESTSKNDLKKYLKNQKLDGTHLQLSFVDSRRFEDIFITIKDNSSWDNEGSKCDAGDTILPISSKNNMVIIKDTSSSSDEDEKEVQTNVEFSKVKSNLPGSKSKLNKLNNIFKPLIKACKDLTKSTEASQEINNYKKPNMLECDKEKERKIEKQKKKKFELKRFEPSWMLDYNLLDDINSSVHITVHSGVLSFFGDAMD